MKATINGIEVEGTPEEIVEYQAIQNKRESEARKNLMNNSPKIQMDHRALSTLGLVNKE